MDVETFITTFHNIQGETLGEKQAHFNRLLKSLPPNHEQLLDALTPQNRLEHLFRLKLLLTLQRLPDLLELLKSEEEFLPAKLLKNRWFCQQLTARLDENSSGFVDHILPFLSYCTRKRLIRKLAVFGTKLDEIFDQVCGLYGIHFAADLLVGCTSQKIEDVLNQYVSLRLPDRHVKVLYRKYPEVFDKFKDQNSDAFHYVAHVNISHFMEMMKGNGSFVRTIGKRLTTRFFTLYKDRVIANTDNCVRFLNFKTLLKKLRGEDFKNFIDNYCPQFFDTSTILYGTEFSKLRTNLGSRYYETLCHILATKYNRSIYDFPELVTEKMMETMTAEERQKWVTIKEKAGVNKNDLIPFLNSVDAFKVIKDKINVTSSIGGREELIQLLVKACKVNNDLNVLDDVGKYICERHRNDNEKVLTNFIYSLMNFFQLEKLEDRHWKSIDAVLKNLERQGVDPYFRYDLYVKKIEFLFLHQKLTSEDVFNFLKFVRGVNRWPHQMDSKDLEKLLLVKSVEFMPKLIEKEKTKYAYLKVVGQIFRWNQEHTNDQIPILDRPLVLESLKKAMSDAADIDDYIQELLVVTYIFETLICTKKESELRQIAIANYFRVGYRYYDLDIDLWLLKHQPKVILKFFDAFLDHLYYGFAPNIAALTCVKSYTGVDFQRRVVSRGLELLKKTENLHVVFATLASLEPSNEYLEHIAPFYPSSDKIEDGSKSGDIALAVARSFKYCSSHVVLPTVITYCKGDFLGRALESLYYLFNHLPGNHLSTFIQQLSSKAVSVRKHSIFLTFIVGTVSDVKSILKKFFENERNVSVQKHLFTAALKYFVNNPSDEFWDYLKLTMGNLDKNDSESVESLVRIDNIPKRYQARYVIFVWEIFKKIDDVDKYRLRLLSNVSRRIIEDIPLEFIQSVVTENFFQGHSEVAEFLVDCFNKSHHKAEIMAAVFEIITQVDWSDLQKEKAAAKTAFNFVARVVRRVETLDTLQLFSQKWHSVFTPTQAMREHLKLTFAVLYLESDKDLGEFSKRICAFLESIVASYGLTMVEVFAAEAQSSLRDFLGCYHFGRDFYEFCLMVLKNPDLVYRLFVIKLLPLQKPLQETHELYLEVIKALRETPDNGLQVLLNLYIRDAE